jgi:hypothetical protein
MSKYKQARYPDPLFDVVSYDDYKGGDAFLTASKLTISPRQYWLEQRHGSKLSAMPIQNLEDSFDSFIGTAIHFYFEHILTRINSTRYGVEKRLFFDLNLDGEMVTVSGQYDVLDMRTNMLYDIKTMSVGKYQSSISNPEYLDAYYLQLHFNRFLLEYGYMIIDNQKVYPNIIIPEKNLKLIAILKDYDPRSYATNYPDSPYQIINVPELSNAVIKEFLYSKVKELKVTEVLSDNELPECNSGYRFQKSKTYPVFKLTQKGTKPVNERAMPGTADFRSEDEAMIYIANHKEKDKLYFSVRESIPLRCLRYCDVGKAGFCNWINNWKENQNE